MYQFDKVEDKHIALSKYLPLIIEETGFVASLITNRYEWAISGIIGGNFLRIAMLHWNPAKNGRKALEETINSLDNGKSLEENALGMLEYSSHRKEVDDYKDLNDNP